jgi:alpha-galactosidase
MLFESQVCPPESARIVTEQASLALEPASPERWTAPGIEVTGKVEDGAVSLSLRAAEARVLEVRFSWRISAPQGTRFLNDHWERGYGDLEWRGLAPERCFPWYFAAFDGARTSAVGVQTQPASLCRWEITPTRLSLICDVRNGRRGVCLGARELQIARVVTALVEDESPFDALRAFCRRMCPNPRTPVAPVCGFNDWYYAYGRNTRETILRDAGVLSELSPGGDNRLFCVIDAGWQVGGVTAGGPWDRGNRLFGDMAQVAEGIRGAGVRPGIWIRPLPTMERVPESWICGRVPEGALLDPSVPEALEQIRGDLRRLTGEWGYELVKHDFSTYDLLGAWGFELNRAVVALRADPGYGVKQPVAFHDAGRTTAEIILDLYRTIREACGDAIVLGCNTIGHLAAGLVDVQRTGDDTSGREWARTRKMGVNTLAFRMPQHEAFFAADADCVGLTRDIPWELNRQWLDLLARSGTALFVSADPEALGPEQRSALRDALATATLRQAPGEPLDWLDNALPSRWRLGDHEQAYDWFAAV